MPTATPAAPDDSNNPLAQIGGFFNKLNYANPQNRLRRG
jgi:hypothetical protein